jgi:TPR repeat protein/glycosyltransferase involved in cell wall biosynthesis/predicted phosphohydrolase
MKKKKVLQIGGNAQINGITTFLLNYYCEIKKDFDFVFINCAIRKADERIKNEILSLGGRIYHIPYTSKFYTDYSLYLEELRKVIRIEKPLIIQSNFFLTNGLYLKLAFEENIPIRISCCLNDKSKYISKNDESLLIQSREFIEQYATTKLAISYAAGKFMYGDNSFEILHPIVPKDRFYPILNRCHLFKKYQIDPYFKYSIFVGRFSFQKNIHFLIDLAERCCNSRKFIMVGEGFEKEGFLKEVVERHLCDRFFFFETYDTLELYNLADSLILPSLYEGFPLVLIEAQLIGLPCIVSDNVTQEVNMGLCKFLKLDVDLWIETLRDISNFPKSKIDFYNSSNDENITRLLDIYQNSKHLSSHYIIKGKEYMLGGDCVCNDWNMVFKYFKMAHELENDRGTFYYSLLYFEGQGVEKNIIIAQKMVKKISKNILLRAQANEAEYLVILADMYSFGLGKKQSFKNAFDYYYKSALLDNFEAMCNLGYMFMVGQGVAKDLAQSFYWYKKSADGDYLHSIRDLGQSYYWGIGTNINYVNAVACFEKASRKNYSHATSDLAICYLQGKGVKQNINKAINLFLLSIKQDRNRAIRDILAHNIDVESLIKTGIIKFISRKKIQKIDRNILVDKTIFINKEIEDIDVTLFYHYTNVNKFFAEKENRYYYTSSGVLYSKDKRVLVRFPSGMSIMEFLIPEFVEIIGDYAFQNCRNLKKIVLQNGVKIIGNSAFDDCKNLKNIIIPASVWKIGDWAFHGCDNIKEFRLSENVKMIGKYAFGSCERLEKIEVDGRNDFYKSVTGSLYSKDMKCLYQYAIGKKEKIFSLPKETETIEFRAFSDAYSLRLVDSTSAKIVKEKAFYYCKKLKKVLLHKNCQIIGKEVFSHTALHCQVKQHENGRTIVVADIHGHLRLEFLDRELSQYHLQKNDVVIILGDAGIIWSNPMNEIVQKFYSNLPCIVLFLDGNHENYELLYQLKRTNLYGAEVHKVLKNVYHLIRGNVYLINGLKYFVFGGAYSIKREDSYSHIPVWDEEMPNDKEYARGKKRLKENDWTIDIILTHQAPRSVLDNIKYLYSMNEIKLLDYLESIKGTVTYSKWYFGHIHRDLRINKFISIYEKSEVVL